MHVASALRSGGTHTHKQNAYQPIQQVRTKEVEEMRRWKTTLAESGFLASTERKLLLGSTKAGAFGFLSRRLFFREGSTIYDHPGKNSLSTFSHWPSGDDFFLDWDFLVGLSTHGGASRIAPDHVWQSKYWQSKYWQT